MRLVVGSDHAGLPLKKILVERLSQNGIEHLDLGTHGPEPVDYPDYARVVAEAVIRGEAQRGLLVCGSGEGAAIAANKFPGIRAALCHDTYSARQSVEHDDANVLALGARVVGSELALEILRVWLASEFSGVERHLRRVEKITQLERRFPLVELRLHDHGVWYDGLRRATLVSGELRRLIREGIGGVSSSLLALQRAIAGSSDYDDAIRSLAAEGRNDREIAAALHLDDVRQAAEQLRPVYELSEGADGFVTAMLWPDLPASQPPRLPASPEVSQALELHNVLVDLPATPDGIAAAQDLIAASCNVKLGLIHSMETYQQAAKAYLRGLERLAASGQRAGGVTSVASVEIGPVDAAVDALLAQRLLAGSDAREAVLIRALMGKAAIANARLIYQRYNSLFSGPRWEALAANGALPQRLLWTSTACADPARRDVRYVEELIGANTRSVVSFSTLQAFMDHGYVRPSLEEDLHGAASTVQALARHGIDLSAVTQQLDQGVTAAMGGAAQKLLSSLTTKRVGAGHARPAPHPAPAQNPPLLDQAIQTLTRQDAVRRIWLHDPDLWKPQDPYHAAVIRARLGWLHVIDRMQAYAQQLRLWAESFRPAGFRRAVLMGMGGSSLAAEVLWRTFGASDKGLELSVLDTTDPATILKLRHSLDLAETLFIVASKSGTTAETLAHFRYFYEQARATPGARAGEHFVAITDAGSPLERLALDRSFRHVFVNPADIGGRYSALSLFGLVPASLIGVDVPALLERADYMAHACAPGVPLDHNPGLRLAAALAAAARDGRDKVTLLLPPALASLGAWIEQLVAESTGKEGQGLIPIDAEPLGAPGVYGSDRLFVNVLLKALPLPEGSMQADRAIRGLAAAGHPVVSLALEEPIDLGAEFFRWEFAVAVVGALLGVDPFDEPNVQESKDNTRQALNQLRASGRLPTPDPALHGDGLSAYGEATGSSPEAALVAYLGQAQPGDYVALQAYLPVEQAVTRSLQALRLRIRDGLGVATTLGFGPRFLHSSGQLHKGGPNSGLFVQLTADDAQDVAIPGEPFGFSALKAAQALGDFLALRSHGRRVLRVHLGADAPTALGRLSAAIAAVLSPTRKQASPGGSRGWLWNASHAP